MNKQRRKILKAAGLGAAAVAASPLLKTVAATRLFTGQDGPPPPTPSINWNPILNWANKMQAENAWTPFTNYMNAFNATWAPLVKKILNQGYQIQPSDLTNYVSESYEYGAPTAWTALNYWAGNGHCNGYCMWNGAPADGSYPQSEWGFTGFMIQNAPPNTSIITFPPIPDQTTNTFRSILQSSYGIQAPTSAMLPNNWMEGSEVILGSNDDPTYGWVWWSTTGLGFTSDQNFGTSQTDSNDILDYLENLVGENWVQSNGALADFVAGITLNCQALLDGIEDEIAFLVMMMTVLARATAGELGPYSKEIATLVIGVCLLVSFNVVVMAAAYKVKGCAIG